MIPASRWVGLALLLTPVAHAELVNFDLSGGIYTKWLYRNNDSQGLLSYGNPFWPDNLSGDNGVGSEFELGIKGRVGENVEAGARLQSRFGSLWQDWWENGDINYEDTNTSGESLGMNHAQYIKLRGYYIRASLPIDWIDSILVGSSDFGMFNEWTIGKVRYIDRDNGKGVFVQGTFPEYFRYHTAIIALPKLFVGPGWSTGIGDPNIRNPFWARDLAYGLRFDTNPADGLRITSVTTATRDSEIDLTDPDAAGTIYPTCEDDLGNPVPGCEPDGAVDTYSRYSNTVSTLELQYDGWDGGSFNAIGGYSYSTVDPQLAANGVALNEGVFPIPFGDFHGSFAKVRGEFFDIGVSGLGLKLEYFNISEHFVTIFGARREADVLLTDGFLDGGQLPTLNLANEFIDFDDSWYESIVGWHGATAVLEYKGDVVDLLIEQTAIGYNTNVQNRDVDEVYPTFLHSEGYTDTDVYDYANVLDRGRDPRSVYRRHQKRFSDISVVQAVFHTGLGRGFDIGVKGKFILDMDSRQAGTDEDNYLGLITRGKAWLSYPFVDGMSVTLGTAVDYWKEQNRKGTPEQGYGDDVTTKVRPFLDFRYVYQGFELRYYLEYVYKDQQRERDDDRSFHILRSKAELKVAW